MLFVVCSDKDIARHHTQHSQVSLYTVRSKWCV